MTKQRLSRLTGTLYVIGALVGLVISLGGLIGLWATRADVVASVMDATSLAGQTLDATHETVMVIDQSLNQAAQDLDTVQAMLMNAGQTLQDSGGLIESTGELVGENMVGFVVNTQSSLESVQNSARMVDNVLGTLNGIPILGPWLGGGYRPELTLQESVVGVSVSMDPLPDNLRKIQRDLDVAAANVATLQVEIETLAGQVAGIKTSVSSAQAVTAKYREILVDVQDRYDHFEQRLPGTINALYLVVTVVLVWVLLTQIGMFIHGIGLMG